MESLTLLSVQGLDRLLPVLPVNLRMLTLRKCGLKRLPGGWCQHRSVEVLDLAFTGIQEFPVCVLENPSLKMLFLNYNSISNMPPIRIPAKRSLRVNIHENPIKYFSPENEQLVRDGKIIR